MPEYVWSTKIPNLYLDHNSNEKAFIQNFMNILALRYIEHKLAFFQLQIIKHDEMVENRFYSAGRAFSLFWKINHT